MGLVGIDEPFTRLFTQGMLLNHIWFRRNASGGIDYYPPETVTAVADAHGKVVSGKLADGLDVEYGGVGKMGKSEQNGVDPQDVIDKYGADTAPRIRDVRRLARGFGRVVGCRSGRRARACGDCGSLRRGTRMPSLPSMAPATSPAPSQLPGARSISR